MSDGTKPDPTLRRGYLGNFERDKAIDKLCSERLEIYGNTLPPDAPDALRMTVDERARADAIAAETGNPNVSVESLRSGAPVDRFAHIEASFAMRAVGRDLDGNLASYAREINATLERMTADALKRLGSFVPEATWKLTADDLRPMLIEFINGKEYHVDDSNV